MNKHFLKIGQISYLNIWPFFYFLKKEYPDYYYQNDHPSLLNQLLLSGALDLAPASAFEYLKNPDQYLLLPDLSISATKQVQSVLFFSPVPKEELRPSTPVYLTRASATSINLLKVLWHFFWKLDHPQWKTIAPGQGIKTNQPFLEIGDLALKLYHSVHNYYVYDLAQEWFYFTHLPFVFALWIVNKKNFFKKKKQIILLWKTLLNYKNFLQEKEKKTELITNLEKTSFTIPQILSYWELMDYNLAPPHRTSLILFGHYLNLLNIIPGVATLSWIRK
ncbi:MAG: menaquinone biosynthesis protein [Desulfonauticus sp.]|nr:menaquinone biosynthesis protein [Desulfonauticus sp.]